ncbi:amidohydrolase family protein [Acuticoccus mangrovi]|uniref:Amidohydrolase family protein n=1 Tax=Acuticoccus mangrovi TaxID=2796142 RepID=A0A934IPG5_9HYPH|nr:amidohydrolase family protein [Acuticoccus mangrovi]MBJ3775912.1 amidohydrolase family protein [Acuticoccus mangrovi]
MPATPEFTIIRGGRLADPRTPDAPFVDILVERDTIREIGPPGLAAPEGALTFEAGGKLMHAGLVNAHTHGHGNLSKGFGDRWTLELLLTAAPWVGGARTEEDKYLSTLIGAAEMLLKGSTACYDLAFEFPAPTPSGLGAIAKAYGDVGMRAIVAPMVADLTFFEAIPGLKEALPDPLRREVEALSMAPADTTLARIREAVETWAGGDTVRPAVAPTIPHHCTDGFLTGCRDIARAHGIGLHSHVAESKMQAIVGRSRYASTLLAHMDRLGLVGPEFVVAHGVWLDDDDMRRLADHGASVAHNPGSNALLGSGIADARRMLDLGVNLGIGTDGSGCSDNQNMYEAMRTAIYVSHARGPAHLAEWLSNGEVFAAATEGSARALGFDRLGRIAPTYQADIVFLDLSSINFIPLNNAINQIVLCEDGRSVSDVMVGGRMVVRDKRVVGLDLARLAADAEATRERLAAATVRQKALFDRLAPLVSSYCPGLAAAPYHVERHAH